MSAIYRRRVVHERIEIPEGHEVCPTCEGQGMLSQYDRGWSSMLPSAELSALTPCEDCGGKGYRLSGRGA